MNVNAAAQALGLGPRGGDLNGTSQAEARQKGLNPGEQHGLHKFVDTASVGIYDEKPWHRMAAYMLLAHRTNSEIALAAEVSVSAVQTLRAQRWFQELLALIANETGEAYLGCVQSEALASLQAVIEIRDDPDAGSRTRLAAAQWIAEQAHGKAIQKVISLSSHSVHTAPEVQIEEIENELRALRQRNTQTYALPEAETSTPT